MRLTHPRKTAAHTGTERLLRHLVRTETENPPGNESACARFVTDWFDERGIDRELAETLLAPDG